MKQILEAINYCHITGICHRDIKLENILINKDDDIKIIDLGIADFVDQKHKNLSGFLGTKPYMAPEILLGEKYNSKCDIWSIGVTFYILLALRLPFLS